MSGRFFALALALSGTLVLASCSTLGGGADSGEQKSMVLLIGVDGLRPDQIVVADAPRLQALAAEGISFRDATNTWRPEAPGNGHSAPNWAALLTGRMPAATGLRVNGDLDRPGDPARRVDDRMLSSGAVRTVFWHAKKAGRAPFTAVFNTWWGIGMAEGSILGRSFAVVDRHFHPAGDGSAAERDAETAAAAAKALARMGPNLTFVHLSQVDAAGHAHTYDAPETRAAIEGVDALVGDLLEAIQNRPTRAEERWLVVLTADHGGPDDATNHADNGDELTRRIPLVLWGDALPPRALGVTGHLVDVAPTILQWLGVPIDGITFDGVSLLDFDS